MGIFKANIQKSGGKMKVSGEFPVSPESQIELTGQNGIGLDMMNSYSCSEDDIHSPKLVPEKELKPVYGTPNQEEIEVLLKSRSKKSKENTPAPYILKQLFTCKKGSIPRCLSKKCKNEMEGSQNFCNKTDCIEQYADYAVDKLKNSRKKLKEACHAVLFNKSTRTVLFWNEFPSKSSLLQFLNEHRDFEMCFPRDDKQICGVKKMIERLEKEDKIWQAQVKEIPDSSENDTKMPIQRTNSSASIDTLNLFGDGSADDRSGLHTNSDSHEVHGGKMSSGYPVSKKIEADSENRDKSVSMENREFDNKTNCECEVNEGVKVTAQMQEDTEDDTCPQTSLDSDSGYFGSSVDVSIHLGSSMDGPDFCGSSVDIEPQGSAVGSKPIDSSCFKSMDSTCFISEDTKSHGSSDPILSRLSKRDPLEQLPEYLAEMNGKLLDVDEIVELACPEDRKPLVEVSSGSAHLEHSSNRYTSASPQLKQCNLYPKGEVLLDISDKQDGLAEQMNLTTTEMIETKEYVSAEIDHETFIQMKEEPFMDNWFTKDNICCHNFVVSKHSSQPGHGTVILHNSMPPSSHATERVEESQTREIVKHSKCSKRKKHVIHDLKMDSILLQKMQEKDNFMLLTKKEILQDRNDYEFEKFIKEKNLSVVKEKNLIVEKREDGKIFAHQITIHIYGITKTKFPEIIKRPRRKSKKKNSRSREKRCSLNVKRMSKRKRIISMVRRGEKQNLNVLTKKRGIKAKEDRIRKRPAFKVQHAGAISYLLSLLRKFLSSGIIPQGLTFLYFCVNGVEGARPTNESYEDYIMYFVRSFFDLLQHLGGSQNFEWRVPIAIGSGAFIWHATRPSSDQSGDPIGTLLGLGVILRGPQVDRIIQGPRLVPSQPTTTPSMRGTSGAEVQRPMTTRGLDVVQRQPEQIYTDHLARQEGTTPSASGVSSTARVPRSSGRGADPPEVFPLASRDIPDTDRVVDIWDKDQHVHRLRVSARETFDIYEKIGPILRGLGWINYILVDDQYDPVETITPGTSRINLHLMNLLPSSR